MGATQTNVGGPWFFHANGSRVAWLNFAVHAIDELPEAAWPALRAAVDSSDSVFRAALVTAYGGGTPGARMGLFWDTLPALDEAAEPLNPDAVPSRTRLREYVRRLV